MYHLLNQLSTYIHLHSNISFHPYPYINTVAWAFKLKINGNVVNIFTLVRVSHLFHYGSQSNLNLSKLKGELLPQTLIDILSFRWWCFTLFSFHLQFHVSEMLITPLLFDVYQFQMSPTHHFISKSNNPIERHLGKNDMKS